MKSGEFNAFTRTFYGMWTAKLLRTLISVKLWTIVSIIWISTWLLLKGLITGTHWTTAIVSGTVAIVLARGAFQIANLKNGHDEKKE